MTAIVGLPTLGPGIAPISNVVIPNSTGTGTRNFLPYANWPHLVDIYIPTTPVRHCYIMLGGAGDTKTHFAYYLNVLNSNGPGGTAQVNAKLLNAFGAMVVIPQGQRCDGIQSPTNNATPYIDSPPNAAHPLGTTTWYNAYMNSGWQDMTGAFGTYGNAGGFLYDLAQYIISTYAPPRLYLGGHSNGGFMAQRWWLEGANIFDGYFSTSGVIATNLIGDDMTQSSCKTKFMWSQLGLQDTVIGIANQGRTSDVDTANAPWYNLFNDTLLQPTAEISVEDLEHTHIGPWKSLVSRVAATSGETVDMAAFKSTPTPVHVGNVYKATYNSGKIVLRVLDSADHTLLLQTSVLGYYSMIQAFEAYLTGIGQ